MRPSVPASSPTWLVPLFVLWSNLDPRMWLGWLALLLAWGGASLSRDADTADTDAPRPSRSKGELARGLGLAVLAGLANPFGWRVLLAPFRMYGRDYAAYRITWPGVPTAGACCSTSDHRSGVLELAGTGDLRGRCAVRVGGWGPVAPSPRSEGRGLAAGSRLRGIGCAALREMPVAPWSGRSWRVWSGKSGTARTVDRTTPLTPANCCFREAVVRQRSSHSRAGALRGHGRLTESFRRCSVSGSNRSWLRESKVTRRRGKVSRRPPVQHARGAGGHPHRRRRQAVPRQPTPVVSRTWSRQSVRLHGMVRDSLRPQEGASGGAADSTWKTVFDKYGVRAVMPRLAGATGLTAPDYAQLLELLGRDEQWALTHLGPVAAVFVLKGTGDAAVGQVDLREQVRAGDAGVSLRSVGASAAAA